MVPRCLASGLGLLAFAISITTGLWVGNPVGVILSRSILALVLFGLIGYVLGSVASMVISEHAREAQAAIRERYAGEPLNSVEADSRGVGDADAT